MLVIIIFIPVIFIVSMSLKQSVHLEVTNVLQYYVIQLRKFKILKRTTNPTKQS